MAKSPFTWKKMKGQVSQNNGLEGLDGSYSVRGSVQCTFYLASVLSKVFDKTVRGSRIEMFPTGVNVTSSGMFCTRTAVSLHKCERLRVGPAVLKRVIHVSTI